MKHNPISLADILNTRQPTGAGGSSNSGASRAGLLAALLATGAACAALAAPPAAPARAEKKPVPKVQIKPATKPAVQPAATSADKSKPAASDVKPGATPAPGAPVSVPGAAGAPTPPPMPAVAGVPPGMIRLDFRGTEIDTVLQAFAMAYKWTVVKDPALTGAVTVIETQPMNQNRAFQVLQALLEVRGFTALLDGEILKVMPLKRAITSTRTVRLPEPETRSADKNQVITDVVSLSNAEAGTLAKDLEPLLTEGAKIIGAAGANALIITDTESNIDRLRLIIGALDKGAGSNEMAIFRLKHVPAKRMTEVINSLFKQLAPRTAAPPPNPNQPQPPPQPGQARPGEPRPAVAAVDDERTNSVIVIGSADNLKRVGDLVKKLDEELNPHTETKIYDVKYADAVKLAQLVNDGLVGGMAGGMGGQPQNSFNPFNPFERRAQGTQSTTYSIGQTRIVADSRTNTLIITADADTMKLVDDLLDKLDKPVEYETTTFTIPLRNAHADDMAYILSQAFGTQQQNFGGGFPWWFDGGGRGSRESRRDRRIQRRVGDQNMRSDAGGLSNVASAKTGFKPGDPAGTQVADGSLPPNFPPGSEQLAQFYYDYYYPSRNRGGPNATTGRNASGKYVNLLQLVGQVLVTPERNTNSLIITTAPENVAAVRDLISDLDVEVKQVLLEGIVAEVTLDKETRFGIDYLFDQLSTKVRGAFPVLPGTGVGPIGADALASGLRVSVLRGDFQAVVTALSRDEKIRILSTPRVFTANNQQAEIEVTDSIPYQKGTSFGFGGTTSTDTDFIDVGLILNVTPRITADGMVTVDVYQEDSNLVEFRNIGQNGVAPRTSQRVTDTSVKIKDGDTLILSGLQRSAQTNTVNKIPLLGDLPIFGNLFRSTTKRRQRTELIVFLMPRVVNNSDEASRLSDQEFKRVQKKLPEARKRTPDGFEDAPGTKPEDKDEKDGKDEPKPEDKRDREG